jgi:hypothetical protein
MRAITIAVLASAVHVLASTDAAAQVLDTSTFEAQASMLYEDLSGNRFGPFPPNRLGAYATEDVNAFPTAAFNQDGFIARSSASIVGGYSPTTPGFVDPFHTVLADMHGEAFIDGTNLANHSRELSLGGAFIELWFSLDQETEWSFEADFAGVSTPGFQNRAGINFQLATQDFSEYFGYFDQGSYNGVGNFSFHGSASGTLQPGSYYMVVGAGAIVENTLGLGGTGSASASVTNLVFTIPSPGTWPIMALLGVSVSDRRRR